MGLLKRKHPIVKQVEMGRGESGDWFWRLRSWNGPTLGNAETYSDRTACHDTARPMADQLHVKLVSVNMLGKRP